MSTTKSVQQPDGVYYVIFEDYLHPKASRKLHSDYGSEKLLQPNIVQHSSLATGNYRKRWRQLMAKLKNPDISLPPHKQHFKAAASKDKKRLKAKAQMKIAEINGKPKTLRDCLARLNVGRGMPPFLAFLRARNDEHLCKRKSGFEIYCELASVHGFIHFVGAKTWQRIFWCLVIGIAILMSITVVSMSHVMNTDAPTIFYTESTTYPASKIPFPAVTICSMNRQSKRRVMKVLQNYSLPAQQIQPYFRYAFYLTDQTKAKPSDYSYLQLLLDSKNYSTTQFLEDIAPDCREELLRCQWQGHIWPCSKLFRRIATPQGSCCTFNYHAVDFALSSQPAHTNSCGYKMGLTVLLQPHTADYLGAAYKMAGYQVLIHAPHDYPSNGVARHLVAARTETTVRVTPHSSYATAYVDSLKLERRRCYLKGERRLQLFAHYTQTNCLAECQSKMIHARCGCVPPQLPRLDQWPSCKMTQVPCVLQHRDMFQKFLTADRGFYKDNHYAENFICSCYPACEFNQYESSIDTAPMDRKYTMSNRKFFKNIEISNHTLLHVFFGDLKAERLRFDAYENWLTFLGTFGGITGLHMGYSFISAFEMIFFVFVRPLCNWLTLQQIRYRIKKRQKNAAAERAKKELEKSQQEKVKAVDEPNPEAIKRETSETIEKGKVKVEEEEDEEKNKTSGVVKDTTSAVQVKVEDFLETENTDRANKAGQPDQLENNSDSVKEETVKQSKLNFTEWKCQEIPTANDTRNYSTSEEQLLQNNSQIRNEEGKEISFDSVRTPIVEKLVEEMALYIAKEIASELPKAQEQQRKYEGF